MDVIRGRRRWIALVLLALLAWQEAPSARAENDDKQVALWVQRLAGYGAAQPATAAEREKELQAARTGIAALMAPERAREIIRKLLSGASWMGRIEGARVAELMGTAAVALLPDLLESLHDQNALSREAATRATAAVVGDSPARPRVVKRLGQLLDDDAVAVRGAALEGLGQLDALGGVLPIQHLLDPVWRQSTLPQLFDGESKAHGSLRHLLQHESWHVRAALLRSLSQWLGKNKDAQSFDPWRAAVASHLADDPSGAVRTGALAVLDVAAHSNLPVAEALLPALSDADVAVRIHAYAVVSTHRLAFTALVGDRLLTALRSNLEPEQAAAAWALRAAPAERDDVRAALGALVDAPPPLGDSARAALLERGGTSQILLRYLVELLEAAGVTQPYPSYGGGRKFFDDRRLEFPHFHASAGWNQQRLLALGAAMTPLLRAQLQDADEAVQARWIHALGYAGPAGLVALRELNPMLPARSQQVVALTRVHRGDRDSALLTPVMTMLSVQPTEENYEQLWEDRQMAEDALLLLGTVAVPALIDAIRSNYDGALGVVPEFVVTCSDLLKKIGEPARPLLEKAAKDEKLGWKFQEILENLAK